MKISEMQQKVVNKFIFMDNCIWIRSGKLSLLQKECMFSAVNVWKNSLEFTDTTKRDIFQLNFHQGD